MSLTQIVFCKWAPFSAYTYTSPILGLSFQNPRREIHCAAVHGPPHHRNLITWRNFVAVKSFPTADIPHVGITRLEHEEQLQEIGTPITKRHYVPGNGLFFSCASLKNVIVVKKCTVGRRVVGLLLQYRDGLQQVLGQWHVENTYSKARIETEYDWRDHGSKCAKSFEFQLEGEESRRVVLEVKFWDASRQRVIEEDEQKFSGYCDDGEVCTVLLMFERHVKVTQ